MHLIVGLGNPGPKYENTRHNIGYKVLDLLSGKNKWVNWQEKYEAFFLKLDDIILAKPFTFMNKSGESVKEILKYYPDSQLIVVHDDLDLPFGSIKIQRNISAAGHNGIQNIIDELGTQDFIRIRLGIDSPERGLIPGDAYVLQQFKTAEEKTLVEVLEKAVRAIETIQTDGLEIAQSRFNG